MNPSDLIQEFSKIAIIAYHENIMKNQTMTINLLVIPVLRILGYKVDDPSECVLESKADPDTSKKGKKNTADLIIYIDREAKVIIEAKASGVKLDGFEGQLKGYYNEYTTVKLGILTNGVEYRLFTDDLKKQNIMDENPFITISIDNLSKQQIEVFSEIARDKITNFDVPQYSRDCKIREKLIQVLKSHFFESNKSVSDEMARWILEKAKALGSPLRNITRDVIVKYKEMISLTLLEIFSSEKSPIKMSELEQEAKIDINDNNLKNEQVAIKPNDYSFSKIRGFIFQGKSYPVKDWPDMLVKLSEQIYMIRKVDFSKCEELSWISKDATNFKSKKEVCDSGYFVNRNVSANNAARKAKKLLSHFSIGEEDISFLTERKK